MYITRKHALERALPLLSSDLLVFLPGVFLIWKYFHHMKGNSTWFLFQGNLERDSLRLYNNSFVISGRDPRVEEPFLGALPPPHPRTTLLHERGKIAVQKFTDTVLYCTGGTLRSRVQINYASPVPSTSSRSVSLLML